MANFRFASRAFVVLVGGGCVETNNNKLTSLDVVALSSITRAQLSACGKVLLRRQIADVAKGGVSTGEVTIIPHPHGMSTEERLLIPRELNPRLERWSSNGTSVYFLGKSPAESTAVLYGVPVDGFGGAPVVIHTPKRGRSIREYSVSPDGLRLAYTTLAPPRPKKKKPAARCKVVIVDEDRDSRAVELHVVDLVTGVERIVPMPTPKTVPLNPVWGGEGGRRLALFLADSRSTDDTMMTKRLHLVDYDGEPVPIQPAHVPCAKTKGGPVWSPDGRLIVFVSGVDKHDPAASTLQCVAVPTVHKASCLSQWALTPPHFQGHVTQVQFSEDSKSVLFTASEGCGVSLRRVRVGRRDPRRPDPSKVLIMPGQAQWTHFSAHGDRIALTGSTASHPAEAFLGRLASPPASTSVQRVTRSNESLEGKELGRQTVLEYRARDGLPLQGVLVWPCGYQPGRRYPLLACVHGGPESHVSDGWCSTYSRPGQLAASNGYFCFYPNYRSSTGRGVTFSKLGQGRLSQEEFDDIVDGVEACVTRGLANEEKIGICGVSYGGYAAAWGATKLSDKFAAASMMAGVSNQTSKINTTDIPEEMFLVHWRKRLSDNWQQFLEASPVFHVASDRHASPILIAHGANDTRVSPTQATELYRALKAKGDVATRLLMYPGEGHGLKKHANRLDFSMRQLAWFDWFLKEEGKGLPDREPGCDDAV